MQTTSNGYLFEFFGIYTLQHFKFDPLNDAYELLDKDALAPALVQHVLLANGLDAGLAVVDLQLAMEARVFVGCHSSTFSMRVAQERFKRGAPSLLYNCDLYAPSHNGECVWVQDYAGAFWADGGRITFF